MNKNNTDATAEETVVEKTLDVFRRITGEVPTFYTQRLGRIYTVTASFGLPMKAKSGSSKRK